MRFDFEPLQKATGLTMRGMAAKLGNPRNTQTLYKYKREGFSFDMAEKYAGRFGFHPCEIWPAWMDESIRREEARQEEKAENTRRRQREWARNRYQSDPAYREIRKQRALRYHAECRDYVLAQMRRRQALRNEANRLRYATDPAYRDARKASSQRRYYSRLQEEAS